jgi:Aerobic-type carbon monoxide dehydrogenase, small subunit CoxS/CutS homologs
MQIKFRLNSEDVTVDTPARTSLADCLRHDLHKTGTHVACEHGVCGACTVIVDGEAVRACLVLAAQADGCDVVTVEGLAPEGGLSVLQERFHHHHALQCGFCTPGFLMTAHALLTAEPEATRERIREVLSGNLCRCTGYVNIVEAVYEARHAYQSNR